jgi:hypothetical protein
MGQHRVDRQAGNPGGQQHLGSHQDPSPVPRVDERAAEQGTGKQRTSCPRLTRPTIAVDPVSWKLW